MSRASQAKYASLFDNLRTASIIQGEKAKIDADTSIHLSRLANKHVKRVETPDGEIDREQLEQRGGVAVRRQQGKRGRLKLLALGKEAMAGQTRKNRLEGMTTEELLAELAMKQAEMQMVLEVSTKHS